MGRYSDSNEDSRHHRKKSKKSQKHKRHRSKSRSHSRNRSHERERSRHRKRSKHSSRQSRSRSRSHHKLHHSSYSRSRSTSRSQQDAVRELINKVKERERQSKQETSSEIKKDNVLQQMTKAEKLEYKLQKALHVATLSDQVGGDREIVKEENEPESFTDDVRRQDAINAIDDDGFVASTFISNRSSGLASTGSTSFRPADAHAAAMFGTSGTSKALLQTTDLSTGVTSSIASTAAATNRVKQLTGKQLAGESLCVPTAVKEKRWLQKLMTLRRRKMNAATAAVS